MTRMAWVLCLWAVAAGAQAQPAPRSPPQASQPLRCPAPTGASRALEGVGAESRLAFLQRRLEREQPPSRAWTIGWGLGYGALTLGQLGVAPAVSREDRIDMYVGAVTTAIAIAPLVLLPLETLEVAPPPSLALGCSALAEQEARFFHAAQTEADGRGLVMHGVNVAYNVLAGLVLGLAFGHWVSGAVSALVGIALGEAQIWTQPSQLVSDAERYRSGNLTGAELARLPFQIGGSARGVQISLSF